MDKGELDGAIINYKKALSLKPDDAEIHYNIGNALQNKGALDEAIEYYQLRLKSSRTMRMPIIT
jgi:tetratricopeptide (TPR) repeat protein